MTALRALLHRHLIASWALIALALAMKLLVPAGFMPSISASGITVAVCTGTGPMTVTLEIPGKSGEHKDAPAKSDSPCAFAGLNVPALGGADPIQLAIALAAILIAGLLSHPTLHVRQRAFLRPPSRGPPAQA